MHTPITTGDVVALFKDVLMEYTNSADAIKPCLRVSTLQIFLIGFLEKHKALAVSVEEFDKAADTFLAESKTSSQVWLQFLVTWINSVMEKGHVFAAELNGFLTEQFHAFAKTVFKEKPESATKLQKKDIVLSPTFILAPHVFEQIMRPDSVKLGDNYREPIASETVVLDNVRIQLTVTTTPVVLSCNKTTDTPALQTENRIFLVLKAFDTNDKLLLTYSTMKPVAVFECSNPNNSIIIKATIRADL